MKVTSCPQILELMNFSFSNWCGPAVLRLFRKLGLNIPRYYTFGRTWLFHTEDFEDTAESVTY